MPLGSRILDVGAGLGASVAALRGRGFDAVGTESDEALRQRALATHPDAPVTAGSSAALPWPDGSFDAVLMECVLSLVEEDGALTEIGRVLRPEGALVVSDLYCRRRSSAAAGPRPGRAGCIRSEFAVRALLAGHGFAVGLWEDHSPLIAELAGAAIMRYGSVQAFLTDIGLPPLRCAADAEGQARLGYFLCVARRETTPAGSMTKPDGERSWMT
jgi:SAM-dependent methyltransferase